ncbi:adenosine deaminase [Treponema sp. JC4]|uniref:adenosine deaminase n=1 Tax=Treponema sp. JC4 TaxID=1124982 RepID=UPI00025B045B|nr:adenosine deaminase [Treponema sp. JC4]EID86142.1 adenosine deaminase [Treponema sp. JC4]
MKKADFKSFLQSVPKAELHLHLEAVISLAGVKKLYKNKFGKEMPADEQKALFSYNDLNGFIQSFLKIQGFYSSVKDFNLVFDELEKYLVKNGIVYAEVFFAPSAFLKMGFKYEDMVEIFHKKISRIREKRGIIIKMLMDVSRTFGCENAMNNYNILKSCPCEDIIGIGLGGAEAKGPAKEFEPVFTQAHKDGFRAVAHAGEDVGPESIWDAINYLHSERIGHGLTAMQDEKLMEELSTTKLPVEICITSNTFTKKVITKASEHPVADYFKRGIIVTINTDDPVFFKTTLLDEFYICHKDLKMSMEDIKTLVEYSFTASFMQDSDKKALLAKVNEAWKNCPEK